MILGHPVTLLWMLIGGMTLFAMIVIQVLLGMRKLKLGRRTFVYHRYLAFAILGVALVHGMLGLLLFTGFRLF